jgi:hypothetical protein
MLAASRALGHARSSKTSYCRRSFVSFTRARDYQICRFDVKSTRPNARRTKPVSVAPAALYPQRTTHASRTDDRPNPLTRTQFLNPMAPPFASGPLTGRLARKRSGPITASRDLRRISRAGAGSGSRSRMGPAVFCTLRKLAQGPLLDLAYPALASLLSHCSGAIFGWVTPIGHGLQPPGSGSPIRRPKRSSSSGNVSGCILRP